MNSTSNKNRTAAAAIAKALERERSKRAGDLKPIEIVKVAIGTYLAHISDGSADAPIESDDRRELRRGTQAAVDRLLFNANYWRAAYEDHIVAACSNPDDALACLRALAVWNSHTLRLNKLKPDEVVETFERFCPPFAQNRRRGSGTRAGNGSGPVPDFKRCALEVAQRETTENSAALRSIIENLEAEARAYERLGETGPLDALFAILPAWCLQDRIELVNGGWWDDCDVMEAVIEALCAQFGRDGFGEAACRYFADSCHEAIDAYQREVTTEDNRFADKPLPDIVDAVRRAREEHPDYETDGYGPELPSWLIGKEQLIWNVIVCAVYGPRSARPLLVESPGLIGLAEHAGRTDVITELAETSFARYSDDRAASDISLEFATFADQPDDLRNSSIAHVRSIPEKLKTLGYEIVPAGSCYPDQQVTALTASEVECLAILEHRRWIDERTSAGWAYGERKDIEARTSPYLVAWEELPERAREWNRSAVRNIPALLASASLAISR